MQKKEEKAEEYENEGEKKPRQAGDFFRANSD